MIMTDSSVSSHLVALYWFHNDGGGLGTGVGFHTSAFVMEVKLDKVP